MTDLSFLLRRMNQRTPRRDVGRMEDAAITTLVGVVTLLALAGLL